MRAARSSVFLACTLLVWGCGDSGRSAIPVASNTEATSASAASDDSTAPLSEGDRASTVADAGASPSVAADGALSVIVPADAAPPTTSRWEVVKLGSGDKSAVGDLVEISYEMYSSSSGELVESTEGDLAGPLPIILGDQHVPAILEHAVLGQPVGSRLLVVFEADLPDLPSYFEPSDAFVLAVDVVSIELDPDRPD